MNHDLHIRSAQMTDADALTHFIDQLDHESDYLLYAKGERGHDAAVTERYLSQMLPSPKSIVLLALEEDVIKGYLCGEVHHLQKVSHVMKINLGVLQSHQRQSIASGLMVTAITQAKQSGITRLEAEVLAVNRKSLKLFHKFNFIIEGMKSHYLKMNEAYFDLVNLGLLL